MNYGEGTYTLVLAETRVSHLRWPSFAEAQHQTTVVAAAVVTAAAAEQQRLAVASPLSAQCAFAFV